jgi:hypothetical protein
MIARMPGGELRERLEGLPVAVLADVLDGLGRRRQAMASRVRPLFESARVAGGRARFRSSPRR